MTQQPALAIEGLEFHYGPVQALAGISFTVGQGEIFGLLGPNGGGKTTLFRVLSTLVRPPTGRVEVFGHDLGTDSEGVRECIGVVFQHPSVDLKLTVHENLKHHGMLHGLRGRKLEVCIDASLRRLGIRERADEVVETLSGGLRRRVELAKGLVTRPRLLILDEPSNGLDPGARRDLWEYLRSLREQDNATILLTTHLMDEAEHCDRLAILDRGRIVTIGTPDGLRRKIGGEIITIRSPDPDGLSGLIAEQFGTAPTRLGDLLRIERPQGHVFVRQLVESFSDRITAISLGKPTLEDVFVHETGHRFWGDA